MQMEKIYLHKNLITSSILALLKINNILLYGEGTFLKCIDLKKRRKELALDVFKAANIHGIKEWHGNQGDTMRLLIYGGKSIAVISLNKRDLSCSMILQEYELEDWIMDASYCKDETLLILTSHNKILELQLSISFGEYSLGTESSLILDEGVSKGPPLADSLNSSEDVKCNVSLVTSVECLENSLLYCGHIWGSSFDCCTVIAGTAFGNIVIWLPESDKCSHKIQPLYCLQGPKGAIFSLTFNEDCKLLSSTSDDRSVRLWKVSFVDQVDEIPNNPCSDKNYWKHSKIEQLFCSYGHLARVWRSLILEDQSVLSCGEDSQVCHWSVKGELLSHWRAYAGANIWCLISDNYRIYTGGGDGAIKTWTLEKADKQKKEILPLPLKSHKRHQEKQVNLCSEKDKHLKNEDFPRTINMIDSSSAVVVSNNGYVWIWEFTSLEWSIIYENSLLIGYVITATNEESRLFYLGTLSGNVIIIYLNDWSCICESKVSSGKIQSLICADNVLLTCDASGIIHVWTFIRKDANGYLQLLQEHHLPYCRQHWITAFALWEDPLSAGSSAIVVGDPCGNVHLFMPDAQGPVQTLKGLHGRHGVSSINRTEHYICTTGRNGYICFLKVQNNKLIVNFNIKVPVGNWLCGIIQWNHQFIIPVFVGTRLKFWNVTQEQVICDVACGGGHRSWDSLIGKKHFHSSGKLKNLYFMDDACHLTCCFLKDGVPILHTDAFASNLLSTIKTSVSAREIQCLKPLWVNKEKFIFACGGEDTLLHIQIVQKSRSYRINSIKSHLSSVRCLVIIDDFLNKFEVKNHNKDVNELFLLSCGGRAQIKVWKCTLTELGQDVMYDSSSNHSSKTGFKRMQKAQNSCLQTGSCSDVTAAVVDSTELIPDVDDEKSEPDYYCSLLNPLVQCQEIGSHMLIVESQRKWKCKYLSFDPETRYMDSLALWITDSIALLAIASSDGYLRFFKYVKNGSFAMLHAEDCSFCLLCLCLLKVGQTLMLTAATTRGNLIFWNLEILIDLLRGDQADELDYRHLTSLQVDCSGINSIAGRETCTDIGDKNKFKKSFLAVGCDSGRIHIVDVGHHERSEHPMNQDNFVTAELICNAMKHAAQVSGLAWLSDDILCSVSTDQRLIVWKFEGKCNLFTLTPMSAAFTSVPDIQGLSLLPHSNIDEVSKVLVFGAGTQMFCITKEINVL